MEDPTQRELARRAAKTVEPGVTATPDPETGGLIKSTTAEGHVYSKGGTPVDEEPRLSVDETVEPDPAVGVDIDMGATPEEIVAYKKGLFDEDKETGRREAELQPEMTQKGIRVTEQAAAQQIIRDFSDWIKKSEKKLVLGVGYDTTVWDLEVAAYCSRIDEIYPGD